MDHLNASSIEAAIPFVGGIISILVGFSRRAADKPQAARAKKVLRWVGLPLIVFGIFMFIQGQRPAPVRAEALVAAMKAKLRLPVRVDDETQLDDVRALSAKEVGYIFRLTRVTKSQLDARAFARAVEGGARARICRNPKSALLFEAGLSVRIIYQTRDAAQVAEIVVTPGDCGS